MYTKVFVSFVLGQPRGAITVPCALSSVALSTVLEIYFACSYLIPLFVNEKVTKHRSLHSNMTNTDVFIKCVQTACVQYVTFTIQTSFSPHENLSCLLFCMNVMCFISTWNIHIIMLDWMICCFSLFLCNSELNIFGFRLLFGHLKT